jgi:hypothetical protein
MLFGLILAACNLPANGAVASVGPTAWIDYPLNQSVLPLAPVRIVAHGYDEGGVSQFELSVNGAVVNTAPPTEANGKLYMADESWNPPNNGNYTLTIRALGLSGGWSAPVSVVITIGTITVTPLITPTFTPTEIVATEIASSPTPVVPMAIGLENTNCHRGAGVAFENDGTLFTGSSTIIVGINADRNWVLVNNPSVKGLRCWLSLSVIRVNGDLSLVPVAVSPPTPMPTNTKVAPTKITTPTLKP